MTAARDAFVTVAVCYSLPAAVVARSALEARGLPVQAIGQGFASVDWQFIVAIGGIELRVPTALEAEARALLGEGGRPPLRESATFRAHPILWALIQIPAFLLLGLWPLWVRRLR